MTNIYKLYIICFLHTAVALKGEDTYSENSEVAAAPSQCLKASSAQVRLFVIFIAKHLILFLRCNFSSELRAVLCFSVFLH